MKKALFGGIAALALSAALLVGQTAAASANEWSLYNDSNTDIYNLYIGHFTQDDVDNGNIGSDWLGANTYLYVDGSATWSNRRGCLFDIVIADDQGSEALVPNVNLCEGYHVSDDDWNGPGDD